MHGGKISEGVADSFFRDGWQTAQKIRDLARQTNSKNLNDSTRERFFVVSEILRDLIEEVRAVIQRVSEATVRVDGEVAGSIGPGMLVLLGVEREDTEHDRDWLAERLLKIRIFEDEEGRMNRNILDAGGQTMVVSQFTLFGSIKKGSRPSYNRAADPAEAIPLYESFVEKMSSLLGSEVATGVFGAEMKVDLSNDGPVTLVIDSKNKEF